MAHANLFCRVVQVSVHQLLFKLNNVSVELELAAQRRKIHFRLCRSDAFTVMRELKKRLNLQR